ncbi:hypothetical protein RJ639_032168 [Escallonia herrerae]|uniref:Eukaryotic translation initiation factor 3 subunit G n=1 Tax=Escallonia herrerae TaxID=1293975 RepID=A0AA88WU98_9ASTE|nr:hypothetical protein RJ639_032168 [Escallonia herrerae]
MAMMKPNKLRWGELAEDEEIDLDFLLPPPQVIGPDSNGIKKVITYKLNGEGNMVKVTTTSLVRKLATTRVLKRALERRSWAKFGDAAEEDDGARRTMVSTEEIVLEKRRPLGSKAEESSTPGDSLAQLGKGAVLMVCRTCGNKGDHWTAKCPYKDLAPQPEGSTDRPGSSDATAIPPVTSSSTYVPPSKRLGAERSTGTDMRRRNDDNAVRVRNLSEDTCDADLKDLFGSFGPVVRAHVVKDYETGLSRGYGFVNFVSREDAQRAINNLNGYGYDNLILDVQWSAPRAN